MNYHFVSDVIAGGFVGAIVGTYTVQCTGLREEPLPAAKPAGTIDATNSDERRGIVL
jgi:hypothetical protein